MLHALFERKIAQLVVRISPPGRNCGMRLEPPQTECPQTQGGLKVNTNLCRRLVVMVSWCLAACCTAGISSGVANAQVLINQDNAIAGIDSNDAPGFPVTISEPGSYRLSSNLYTGGQTGIVILVSDVTIDLNGFSIRGNAGLRVGIFADNRINHNLVGIVIRNGTISNFRDGIDLGLSTQSIVERIGVHDNESWGIRVGENSTVTGNTASG